ncbi:hypothetical protein [Methylobacter sp.]
MHLYDKVPRKGRKGRK